MRRLTTYALLTVIFGTIGYLFYSQEIKYWIPTPVPGDFQPVNIGTKVELASIKSTGKKFFHFYNPNCPCSKFNTKTYRGLVKKYRESFDCYVVIQRSMEGLSDEDHAFLKELNVNVIVDRDKELAYSLGVYATPQIVLLDDQDRIYYRGNYNQSRYCTNLATNFAGVAIDSMLIGSQYLFPATAFTAYGCSLDRETD